MSQELKKRHEIADELKWDLTALFKSREESNEALEKVEEAVNLFSQTYDGKMDNSATVLSAIHAYEDIMKASSTIGQYASLPVSADITDGGSMQYSRSIQNKMAVLSAKLTFFESQLTAMNDRVLDEVANQEPAYSAFVRKIKRLKKMQLDPAVEKAFAQLSPVLNAPQQVFEQARSADMDFGTFEVDGVTYPLSYVLYEDYYMYHPDTNVRRAAFAKLSSVMEKYQNVVATAYYTQLQKEKTMATMRGFDSIFDYLLSGQEVGQDLYHRQIDLLMEDFAPVMQKFITHVKEANGLETMHYADLKIDLDPDFAESVTIEESKEMVREALAPLGEEYVAMIERAYPERWVDFAQNIGKRSGAFCSTTYQNHPYILMSWAGQLADVYTLFHELGHAGQGMITNQTNALLGARASLYTIEAPSTFHELLLTDYLKEKSSEPRMERSVLAKMISKTYFHNFVTHLLEAAYQREVYRLVDAGESFDAAKLSEIKRNVLEKFWGDAVELEPGAELTWMRQIHYYMGLYSYTYSAGLTIATQAFLRIKEEGQPAIDQWLAFLETGGTLIPQEATLVAGVDITTEKPLRDTIQYLDDSVDRIIELSKEL
ncbi:oligoendopeptidase F [Jeotgalibaca caeni]|uniref:oligoendopeptidase F n=1 Tax=Jeotgalibaca caeni TaxID=3028623 RepID=UPI00237E0FF4|nr:oligoendopeptidase F [Jeotgalibaca caeni]MDE1549850.1 oligoendopeptidase F [Jeotgalibaca caeni]